MKNLHIKFEYDEVVLYKQQLLGARLDLLQILRSIKNYRNLRMRELSLKPKLNEQLIQLKTEIQNLKEDFPDETEEEIEMNDLKRSFKKIVKNHSIVKNENKQKVEEEETAIENQLLEIQKELAELQKKRMKNRM